MKVILGSGIYGLYAALYLGKRCGDRVVVLEYDSESFKRATYINQARVHMGYHYPRSLSTAKKSAHYFNRFMEDFGFSVLTDFKQVYATSTDFSWTNADEFIKFCNSASITCTRIDPNIYFKSNMCDGAFLTHEYTYDAMILRDFFLKQISECPNVEIIYQTRLKDVTREGKKAFIKTTNGDFDAEFILNATYASTNQVSALFGFEPFKIKYELCEIILCEVDDNLKNTGITVMDGPFFSIMPFGKTGLHSLTSVTFTPHTTSYDSLPSFTCQNGLDNYCSDTHLGNCNECKHKPVTAWPYMSKLAKKYLKEEYGFRYLKSLYSIKPILMASEVDDSRPTVIKSHSSEPMFVSVLSGKINTVYDLDIVLDEVLQNG